MEKQTYNWYRYWYPREATITLSNGGYLYRPDTGWSDLFNPALMTLEPLTDIPCLVLLGEPGIGKSSEMEKFETFTRDILRAPTLSFALHGYESEILLQEELFKSPTFQSWITGTHQLHLFLDGLDEGLLTISVLSNLLSRNLQKYPISRLYLRIACRTADWPSSLEESLRLLWSKEKVAVYQLAPLRKEDVADAADNQKLNAEQFLEEVVQKGAAPLASKPLTLGFLFNIYHTCGTFPSTQEELYYEGCRVLCEEQNRYRRSIGFLGNLSSEQRLIVASRIAALTIFTNRATVYTEVDGGDVLASGLTLRELEGGTESINTFAVAVDQKALQETLNTGLFSSRGQGRFGWVHRTYAEFLAAWYLAQHKVSLPQLTSFLIHRGETEKKLVPQLHETAAWMATMRTDVFQQIMQIEPEMLLRSDVATAEENDRVKLVEALLHLENDARQAYLYRNLSSSYWKLDHPGLSAQLSSYIQDRVMNEAIRLLAIDITEKCKLQSLQQDLINIILDSSESNQARIEAAHAIVRIGDEDMKARLKPLAFGVGEDDPDDELKGFALQAVWPAHLTARELFDTLIPPKQQHFHGAYQRFLTSHFITHLQPADLPIALQWIEARASQSDGRYQYSVFFSITDEILYQAWQHLDIPNVLEAFARVIVTNVEHYAVIEDQQNKELIQLVNDESKRHQVLMAALCECSQRQSDPLRLFDFRPPIVIRQDVLWLIDHLKQAETVALQQGIARLIGRMINWNDIYNFELMDTLCSVCQRNPYLTSELAWLLQAIMLDSPEAEQMKEAHVRNKRWEESQQTFSQRANAPSMERIAALLDECEQGNISLWNQVYGELVYRPDGSAYEDEFNRNEFPRWNEVDETMRLRMIEIAKSYVQTYESNFDGWIDTNDMPFSTFVAYKTLQLLMQEMPSLLFELPADRWKQLMPIVLTWCVPGDVLVDQMLINLAHQVIPEHIVQTTLMLIDRGNKLFQEPPVIQKVETCWDASLAHALLEKVKDKNLELSSVECLLRTLLEHHVNTAREYALSLVDCPLIEERTLMQALIAAKLLLRYTNDPGWDVIWPAIQRHEDFGKQLIEKFAQSFSGWVPLQLTEDQMVDLYIWLVRHYPPSQYPIQQMDSIALWRDALIGSFKYRGTFEACGAIQRIAREVPELDQFMLRWILLEAQELAHRHTWEPFKPQEILRMINDSQLRLVQSGEQLLEVVIESLKQLEAKFHDELPAWRDVWDRVLVEKDNSSTKGRVPQKLMYRPKDENEFSDYVARHLRSELKERGIVANREVVIRKTERTDIYVDAVIRGSRQEIYNTVSVIIEVKGCWNEGVRTAMKGQLVNRYLKDNHCCYGLYLIGWFNCDLWDDGDYRKSDALKLKMTLMEAKSQFNTQAEELSQRDLLVKALVLDATVK